MGYFTYWTKMVYIGVTSPTDPNLWLKLPSQDIQVLYHSLRNDAGESTPGAIKSRFVIHQGCLTLPKTNMGPEDTPRKTNMSPQNQMVGRCISPIEIIPSYGDMLVWTGGFSPLGKGETSANQQFSGPPKKTQKRGEKGSPVPCNRWIGLDWSFVKLNNSLNQWGR